MDGTQSLAAILRRAHAEARPRDAAERALAGDTEAARLSAIMREIDETILPRLLTFGSAQGGCVRVEAAGRGVLAVTDAEPEALRDGAPLFSAADDGDSSEARDALCGLLRRLAQDGALTVASEPSPGMLGAADTGISARDLAELCGPDVTFDADVQEVATDAEPRPEPDDPAISRTRSGAFYAASRAFARGAVHADVDGAVRAVSAGEEMISLEDLTRHCAKQFKINAPFVDPIMPGAKMIFMGSAEADRPSIVCAQDQDGFTVATIDGSDPAAALAAWGKIDVPKP